MHKTENLWDKKTHSMLEKKLETFLLKESDFCRKEKKIVKIKVMKSCAFQFLLVWQTEHILLTYSDWFFIKIFFFIGNIEYFLE